MIKGKRVLSLVPARRGSKGLALKNIRPLRGRPLLGWPIAAAHASRYIDRVIVSTDDEEFATIARAQGADTPFLRPAELASDTAPSIGFILHALDTLAQSGEVYDYLVLLEPTSPLTEGTDIDLALEALFEHRDHADAIVGIARMTTGHPAFAVRIDVDARIQPAAASSFGELPRRQDIEPLYVLDGSLYISTAEALRRENGFCHDRTLGHVMPRYKHFEVDDLLDFVCIEAVLDNLDALKNADRS